MNPERWAQVRDLLTGAMELESTERAAFLDRHCSSDPTLRREVEKLLDVQEEMPSRFLRSVGLEEAASQAISAPEHGKLPPGTRLGPYELQELLGAGGMGEVYRAFRADDQYRKQVAVKVVRQGQNSGAVVERFKNERQILADLDHPNIARLLDGGTTKAGDPFFVMELIEGQPIDAYCDGRKLDITKRLELFCQVCSAVEFAHRHLIVHRDIKPSNILVTSDGVPKLLDFGIAKILGETGIETRAETTLTMFRALTPGYASPEQVTGAPITTASDVYSLAVVLYELLAGRSPYRLRSRTSGEIVRAVCEVEPEKLSVAVVRHHPVTAEGSRPGDAAEIAAVRQSSPTKLSRRLRGDLDNIVAMALRKEPQRRYASVQQFAQDIRWNLTSQPVMACKDTLGYRAAKFVKRHKAGVLAAAAVFLTLALGIAVTLREAQIARVHQARAERNFNDVRELANSLIFDIHDDIQELPGATKARKVLLDRALQYLDRLAQDSVGNAGLQRELAAGYERLGDVQGKPLDASLGDNAAALRSYNKSLMLWQGVTNSRESNSDDMIHLANVHRLIADSAMQTGDLTGALDHAKKAVAIAASIPHSDSKSDQVAAAELVHAHLELGTLESGVFSSVGLGDFSAALQEFEKALALNSELLKNDPQNVALAQENALLYERVGAIQDRMGRTAEALQNLKISLDMFRSLASGNDNAVLQRRIGAVASILGDALLRDGQFELALENFREELTVFENLSSRDPLDQQARADLTSAYFDVGSTLHRMGRFREALANIRLAIGIDRDLIALYSKPDVYRGLLALHRILEGEILGRMGDWMGALGGFEEARKLYDGLAQSDDKNLEARLNVAAADTKIGAALLRLGQYEAAEKSYRQAIEICEQPGTAAAPNLEAQYTLADAYSGLGDIAFHMAGKAETIDRKRLAWKEASLRYESSIRVWNAIPNRKIISPTGFDVGDPAEVSAHLARCKAALELPGTATQRLHHY